MKTLKCKLSQRQPSLPDGVPCKRRRISGGKGTGVATDERPWDLRDDPRERSSWCAACGKDGSQRVRERQRTRTRPDRRRFDKTATRNYAVQCIGASTSRWKSSTSQFQCDLSSERVDGAKN